jgi:hypothetical protein
MFTNFYCSVTSVLLVLVYMEVVPEPITVERSYKGVS